MRNGFSLVEMSIALAILGLLVGGILAGQSLIRSSQVNSAVTEYNRILSSIITFRDQYGKPPGDLPNAQSYWGAAPNCPGTSTQGTTNGTTCNGDGNSKIIQSGSSQEQFRIWQHLANAGLLEGRFNGVSGNDAYFWNANRDNSPGSRIDESALWQVYNYDNSAGSFTGSFFYVNLKNFLVLGSMYQPYWVNFSAMKPEEASNIDKKIDDGKPAMGKVMAHYYMSDLGAVCTTASSQTDFTANYNLTEKRKSCGLLFPAAF